MFLPNKTLSCIFYLSINLNFLSPSHYNLTFNVYFTLVILTSISPNLRNLSRSSWLEISFSRLPTNRVRVALGWCSSSSASGGRNSLSSTSAMAKISELESNTEGSLGLLNQHITIEIVL